MKITTKVYLKSFFIFGLPFALLMTLFNYYYDKGEIKLWESIFYFLFFGVFMSWYSVRSQIRAIYKLGKTDLTKEDFKMHQKELISKQNSIPKIFDKLKSDELTGKWKLKIDDLKIVGKTNSSWSSWWGERITISYMKEKIKIESKPVLKTTMFDNGRNRENVLVIKWLIEKQ